MSEGKPRAPELEADGMREYAGGAGAGSTAPTSTSGCGCVPVLAAPAGPALGPASAAAASATADPTITISITPTTGGQFDITVDKNETIENLKKIISKRLKVAKERICLLHRERQLRDGTLEENRLQDGSRLMLLPSVETGLLAQRPEQSVMQALESLSDSQVNDFLSGKAPLNLTMRLGDHMMLIQLQLSTVTPATTAGPGPAPASVATGNATPAPSHQRSASPAELQASAHDARRSSRIFSSSMMSTLASAAASLGLFNTASPSPPNTPTSPTPSSPCCPSANPAAQSQQQLQPQPQQQQQHQQAQTSPVLEQPQASAGSPPTTPPGSQPPPLPLHNRHPSRHRLLHPARHPYHNHNHHHHHHRHHHHHHHQPAHSRCLRKAPQAAKPSCTSCKEPESSEASSKGPEYSMMLGECDCSKARKKVYPVHGVQQKSSGEGCTASTTTSNVATPATPPITPTSPDCPDVPAADPASNPTTTLDTRALVEASRNLTQKLKQLSSEENAKRRQGAIIESMHHHGKGVYTGTFSGTLNPALQDQNGRPKRDISTIIHILNDLLCATPATTAGHYRYHRHPGTHRSTSNVAPSAAGTAASQSSSSSTMFSVSSGGPRASTAAGSAGSLESTASCPDSPNPGSSSEELSKENEATKGKMKRLRLVMEQRREKMRARRQARAAPYTTKWAAVTPDPNANGSSSSTATSGSGSGKSPNDPQNESELKPCSPEPVVA